MCLTTSLQTDYSQAIKAGVHFMLCGGTIPKLQRPQKGVPHVADKILFFL